MKHTGKTSELLNNIFLFFIANFLPRAITFFMVPLYTYCLTTKEYGTVDLMITTVQLLLPFLTLQVQDAMLRFSIDNSNNSHDVLTVGIRIITVGTLILISGCFLGKLVGIITLNITYLVIFVIIYFMNAARNIMSYFCRGINRIKILTVSNVLLTIVTVICNLIFLLLFNWGIYGYLLAMCIGNVVAVLIMFFGARLYSHISLTVSNPQLTADIIKFSVPMIFSALAWWINTSLDKYILGYFHGTSAVGLMAVAYKIPSVISLLGSAIANAYSISAIKEFDVNDTDGFLGKSYSVINSCFVAMCSFLIICNVWIAKILFSKDFFVAWNYVPPLLLSALASQLSLTCEQYYIALKKTNIISITAVIGATINFCANMLFIPKYGAYGAAAATAFSFFITWLLRYNILTKRYGLKLKHNIYLECFMYALIIGQLFLAKFGNRSVILQIFIFVIIIALNIKTYIHSLKNILKKLAKSQ